MVNIPAQIEDRESCVVGRCGESLIADSVDDTWLQLVLRLLDCKDLVGGNVVQHLADSAWPAYFNIFDLLVTRQAKVHPTVT